MLEMEKTIKINKKITHASRWNYDPYKIEEKTFEKPLNKDLQKNYCVMQVLVY